MTIAYWMILAAALLPYLTVAIAKRGATGYDNAAPQDWADRQRGWRARGLAAHRNHFEAFAPFAASVIVAELAHGTRWVIDILAVAFILLRLIYTMAYLTDRPTLRSSVWGLGLSCVIALFFVGIGQ